MVVILVVVLLVVMLLRSGATRGNAFRVLVVVLLVVMLLVVMVLLVVLVRCCWCTPSNRILHYFLTLTKETLAQDGIYVQVIKSPFINTFLDCVTRKVFISLY